MSETTTERTAPELGRYLKELHLALIGRPCGVADLALSEEIARTLTTLEPPSERLRGVITIALEELKGAGEMLESIGFLRRFALRERIVTRALVREALGLKVAGPTDAGEAPIAEEELLSRYIRHLKVEEGRTEHTMLSYRQSIAAFRAFLSKRYLKLKETTREDILAFKEGLLEKGNCPKTVNLRIAALRSLYGFLVITKELEEDPTRYVRKLPEERKRLSVLTPGEVDRFIQAIDRSTPGGLRDYAMVILLFASGGRIGEVTSLKVEDIDLKRGVLTFRKRKNKEDNQVSMTEALTDLLRRYLELVRPIFAAKAKSGHEDLVFLSHHGLPLDRSPVSRALKLYARAAGITKHVSSHTFRRSIATVLANNGMPAELLRVFLGHRNINTTLNNYIAYSDEAQRRALEDYHPLATERTLPVGDLADKRCAR